MTFFISYILNFSTNEKLIEIKLINVVRISLIL